MRRCSCFRKNFFLLGQGFAAAIVILAAPGCMPLTPLSRESATPSAISWDAPPASIVTPIRKTVPPPEQPVTPPPSRRVPVVTPPAPPADFHETAVAAPSPKPPSTKESFQTIIALQIFLDRANFSPNCIDGITGSKTRQALAAWKESQGLNSADEETPDPLDDALSDPSHLFTPYRISSADYSGLAPVPATWRGKSRAAALGYETVRESVAEKFHLSEAALMKLNPDAPWPNPPDGVVLKVPDVTSKRPPKAARISISLSAKQLRAYDAEDHLIALFPCSIGKEESKRPVGVLNVMNAARNPEFVFDPAVFTESEEARTIAQKLVIPAGPNNPVGVAWIGLNRPGYGMHGTPRPEDIGKTESHGCFRLANWNAQKLLKMVEIGIPVVVVP